MLIMPTLGYLDLRVRETTCRLIPCSFGWLPSLGFRILQPYSVAPSKRGHGMSLQARDI